MSMLFISGHIFFFFFFTQLTEYYMSFSDWSSAVCSAYHSKNGVRAHQLHRTLGITYQSAWFLAHRIREAMQDDVTSSGPLGGEGRSDERREGKGGVSKCRSRWSTYEYKKTNMEYT